MAKAESDNSGINGTLDKFFSVFTANSDAGIYKNIDFLIEEVFCADEGGYPWIGISHHGPQFRHEAGVRKLYGQVFRSFPDIWWGPSTNAPAQTTVPVPAVPRAPRLYSNDGYHPPTIGVQTTMVGTLHERWFQDQAYSLPLSAITPSRPPKRTETPSFAVFVFGAKDPTRVSHVSFYMDRYNQARDLQPIHPSSFDTDVRLLFQNAQDRADTQRLIELNEAELSRLDKEKKDR